MDVVCDGAVCGMVLVTQSKNKLRLTPNWFAIN